MKYKIIPTPEFIKNLRGLKKRVKNSDIQKGKSGGYRVIAYLINELHEVQLITIYSKSDREDIPHLELEKLILENI